MIEKMNKQPAEWAPNCDADPQDPVMELPRNPS